MTLREKIIQETRGAVKNKKTIKAQTLRYLLAAFHNREIALRTKAGSQELNDEEAVSILRQEVKKRKEAIELFKRGGRQDLVDKEEEGLKIINEFLPPQISREAIEAVVEELIASGIKEFASLMREAMKRLKGQAEGGSVSEVVKQKLESPS